MFDVACKFLELSVVVAQESERPVSHECDWLLVLRTAIGIARADAEL